MTTQYLELMNFGRHPFGFEEQLKESQYSAKKINDRAAEGEITFMWESREKRISFRELSIDRRLTDEGINIEISF